MLSQKEKELAEKVVTGGGATGVSMTADSVGGTATLPNSKKQGDSAMKAQNPAGTPIEDTDAANNTKPTGDMSAANRASIAMKTGNVKEELAAIFGEDISEEFIERAATLFEAAVALKVAEIEEAYLDKLDEEVEDIYGEMVEKIDQYLTYTAKNWLVENEVAIESSLKTELAEEFIDSLKNVFVEHYIDIPSDKVDVLESLSDRIQELEERLNEEINEKIEMSELLSFYALDETFDDVSEGLTMTQVEKFRTIAENLEFDGNIENYKNKLEVVKENYFSNKSSRTSNILTEEYEGDDSSAAPAVTGEMGKYVTAISRTLKK